MKKTLIFALALGIAFVGQAPSLLAQSTATKVKDKVVGAAETTGKEAKKVAGKTKEVATTPLAPLKKAPKRLAKRPKR